MRLITYEGRLAAVAGADRAYLARHVDVLPDDHPSKRFVLALCLYAHELAEGRLPGEPRRYLPGRAHQFVRAFLMPEAEFLAVVYQPDHLTAAMFQVPVGQVPLRRRDLHIPPQPARCVVRPAVASPRRRGTRCA